MKDCYIYIFTIEHLGLTKVGVSRDPPSRLRQLAIGAPFPIEIVAALICPGPEARRFESHMHFVLRDRRTNGEWFEIDGTDALIILLKSIVIYFDNCGISRDRADCFLSAMGIPPDCLDIVEAVRAL